MGSKTPIPTFTDEESAPPAYTESAPAAPAVPIYQPYSSTSQYYSHQIEDQLQGITSQIKSLETQKSLLSHAKDEKILSLLTTQIQIYLSDFAKAGFHQGTLILVPAKGIETENAVPVDHDFSTSLECDRVIRVRDKEADGFGEDDMFWRDEDMARRLSSYLQPRKDFKNAELPPRKEQIKAAEHAFPTMRRGFWGRKKNSLVGDERPILTESQVNKVDHHVESPFGGNGDQVSLNVRAEEVVFRTENDFGIYETRRGYGIVLKLRVIFAR